VGSRNARKRARMLPRRSRAGGGGVDERRPNVGTDCAEEKRLQGGASREGRDLPMPKPGAWHMAASFPLAALRPNPAEQLIG